MKEWEEIAWKQIHRVCGHYPICIVAPESLRKQCEDRFQHKIEAFPDVYFRDIHTYSQLLMTSDFYQRFIAFEYILIYQLDAFVFLDKLAYFCSLGYDYIGAPLPRWSNYWYSMKIRPGMAYIPFLSRVGNGGFSLRRVNAMLRILQRKNEILATHPLARLFREQEDMFFAYCGILEDGLNIPDVRIAQQFSIEMDVGHCYRNLENHLPFGCHAWHKIHFPIWKKIIEREGYSFHYNQIDTYPRSFRKSALNRYLLERMSRSSNAEKAKHVAKKIFLQEDYAIWGIGLDGKLLLMFLQTVNVHISCIFDRAAAPAASYHGIPVHFPDNELLQRYKGILIIGTASGEESISEELMQKHFFRENEFIKFTVLLDRILRTYFER